MCRAHGASCVLDLLGQTPSGRIGGLPDVQQSGALFGSRQAEVAGGVAQAPDDDLDAAARAFSRIAFVPASNWTTPSPSSTK